MHRSISQDCDLVLTRPSVAAGMLFLCPLAPCCFPHFRYGGADRQECSSCWFSGVERRALKLGDYSISGLEDICVVERKDLSDLVRSFTVERPVFVARLRQMAEY